MKLLGEKICRIQDCMLKLNPNNNNETSIFLTKEIIDKIRPYFKDFIKDENVVKVIDLYLIRENIFKAISFAFSYDSSFYGRHGNYVLDLEWFDKQINTCRTFFNFEFESIVRFEFVEQTQGRGYFKTIKQEPSKFYLRDFLIEAVSIIGFYEEKGKLYIKISHTENLPVIDKKEIVRSTDSSRSFQKIFFGAPGTGKSYKVKGLTKRARRFVVTFHPDTDYSLFMGSYKPVSENGTIKYSFVSQQFLKAYIYAWQHPDSECYLVIEEINRGNCAQIFGDIFQLLDRDDEGYSSYTIDVDSDIAKYIETELGKEEYKEHYMEEIRRIDSNESESGSDDSEEFQYSKIALPKNLSIYATMNTSDQSLFPMDSAFKRRWEWEYVPINTHKVNDVVLDLSSSKYKWADFLDAVNLSIKNVTGSEEKQLGEFFVRNPQGVISKNEFCSKVLSYLWMEIYKEETTDKTIFRNESEAFTFEDIFRDNGDECLESLITNLNIQPLPVPSTEQPEEEAEINIVAEDPISDENS